MRAVTIAPQAGQEEVAIIDTDVPEPGPGEILIEVVAAGVNRADLLQRAGMYPPPPGAPPWPGLEVAGRVKSVGIGVSSWRVGDTAAALLEGGGYAQYATARESQLFPIPRGVSVVEAAGLPEATCTAWTNLVDTGGLRAGDTVLIHGGSGGVGTIAVQLAKALGAFVIATAGGPQRVAAVGQLGADIVIDHRSDDVIAAVRAATDGRGADVILDILGAGGLGANVRALAPGGRLVIIGLQQGRHGELDVGALLAKRATIAGTTLRARTPAEKAALVAMVRERVWPLIEAGQVRPIIDSVLPLAAANDALDRLATGGVFGKLLLAI